MAIVKSLKEVLAGTLTKAITNLTHKITQIYFLLKCCSLPLIKLCSYNVVEKILTSSILVAKCQVVITE